MPTYRILLLLLGTHFFTVCAFEKINYVFAHDPIDVVISCHQKDAIGLERTIKSIKEYIEFRRIIVISSQQFTHNAEWFDEKLFPFNKKSIALEIFKSESLASSYINHPTSRIGWIYQQFLKLFAAYYIPRISSNILIVDADVVFLKPITFLQENGAGLYAVGKEYHKPYFQHIAQLLPGFKKMYPQYSGIVHHILLQKPVLDDLFNLIQKTHNLEAWVALARTIPVINNTIEWSAISEYEIYFNFVFARTHQVKIRPLQWANISEEACKNKSTLKDYDYVAIHIRKKT